MGRKRASGPNRDWRGYGPRREKAQMDQIIIRGSMVHGEKKSRWTKKFSEEAWSMEKRG